MLNIKTRLIMLATVSQIVCITPIMAQDTSGDPAPAQPGQAGDADFGDIVVTANKRTERLSEVGLTVTAISGENLKDRNIVSLEDLSTTIPGLSFSNSTGNSPILTLRGVGFNESSLGVYPAVSVYVDEVPLPFPVMTGHSAYDLERVEVLKGPQGTLFGQNSTGGAINYIAAKPTDTFKAGGDVSFGRFATFEGNAFVSGPLADGLTGRLAVTGKMSDDWQKSFTRDDTLGQQGYMAGRLLLHFEASDRLRFSLNLNGWFDKSDPQAPQFAALRPNVATAVKPELLAAPFSPFTPRAADWNAALEPSSDRTLWQAALRTELDLSDSITLTSLTSYARFTQKQNTDGEGIDLLAYDLTKNDGDIDTFGQEIRLSNSSRSALRWVLGANIEASDTHEDRILNYRFSTSSRPSTFNITESGVTNDQKIRNYAVFASSEYDIADNFTLRASGRYTSTENKTNICGYSPGDGRVATFLNFLGGVFGTVPFTPIGPADCYSLNENNVPGFPFISTLKQDNFSWRVGADFKPMPGTLLYANISRGYKAGSFPSLAATSFAALAPVTQESVTAYEAGIKSELIDRVLNVNAAIFYSDYRNKQIRGRFQDPFLGKLEKLINVPKSSIFGVEADVTFRPLEGLSIAGSASYMKSKVREYIGIDAFGNNTDFKGDELPFTPKLSYNVNVDYEYQMPAGGRPFIGITLNGKSASDAVLHGRDLIVSNGTLNQRAIPGLEKVFRMDAYATVDARIGYKSADDQWRVMIWGKNVFDKYYITNVLGGSDTAARFAGRPATYGITIGANIN